MPNFFGFDSRNDALPGEERRAKKPLPKGRTRLNFRSPEHPLDKVPEAVAGDEALPAMQDQEPKAA